MGSMILGADGREMIHSSDPHEIVDMYGNRMSGSERFKIIETVAGLPATEQVGDFLYAVQGSPIVIVEGATGSGKTTQLPKALHLKYPTDQIIVTQPRVLAAMENARRVADECLAHSGNLRYSLGDLIGYRTGRGVSSNKISPFSFHTDGLELRRMTMSGIFADYLVLDEVHNFAIPTEIIAMLVRDMMRRGEKIKLILMSATLDPEIFREYYKEVDSDIPLIQIPGRTFPVERHLDETDSYIERVTSEYGAGKNILLFVPGKKEIDANMKLLRNILGTDAQIFPLHAEIPREQQSVLLNKDPNDLRPRIIVATNVAEESITIPYIDIVVDLGNHKVARRNSLGIQGLYLESTSRKSGIQRGGRVGRTHPGEYFRHNSVSFDDLPEFPEAPIEREMLDGYILTLLSRGIPIIDILRESKQTGGKNPFFHKFNEALFDISLDRLHALGALTNNNEITILGHELLKFPLDVYTARILYEGIQKGCSGVMVILAAILEKKGFLSKEDEWKELKIATSQESDILGYAALFKFATATTLSEKHKRKLIDLGASTEEIADFIDRNGEVKLYEIVDLSCIGIKNKRVKEIDECVGTILKRLEGMNIEITHSSDSRNIRTCLTTGSLHDIYVYNKASQGFHNTHHVGTLDGKMIFRSGNISILQPKEGVRYLGSPFIIGGNDGSPGMNLLTFITAVDEGILKDARQANVQHGRARYIPPSARTSAHRAHHEKNASELHTHGVTSPVLEASQNKVSPSRRPKKGVALGTIPGSQNGEGEDLEEYAYEFHMEEFQGITFPSSESADDYYGKYCLPIFLMEQNQYIRKYIQKKTQSLSFTQATEWKSIFRELLARFLSEEKHRVDSGNLAKTERSFKHDTGILMRFQESGDRYIRYFRIHGTLPVYQVGGSGENVHRIETGEGARNEEIFQLRAGIARKIGMARQFQVGIDLEHVQTCILAQFFQKLQESDISVANDLEAYNTICIGYEAMQKLPEPELASIQKALKGISRSRKKLHNLQKEMKQVSQIENDLRHLQQGNLEHITGAEEAIMHSAFGNISPEEQARYEWTLEQVRSSNPTQQRKGISALGSYISLLRKNKQSLVLAIEEIVKAIALVSFPEVQEINQALERLVESFFEKEYGNIRIKGKILDTVRALLRDPQVEKKGVPKILFELFHQTHAAEHINGTREKFQEITDYIDQHAVIQTYIEDVLPSVQNSEDVVFIEQQIQAFEKEVEKLKKLYGSVMKNELYQLGQSFKKTK